MKVKKILVVKTRHHGDVLLTSPVFSILKKTFPQAEVDAYIYAETLPMLEGHPAISHFFLYDRRWKEGKWWQRMAKEIALFRQVRRKGYDLVINLTEGDRGALLAKFSGASQRVGFDPEGDGLFGKRKMYTHLVKHCPHQRHTVEKQLDALRCLGIFPEPCERDLFLHVPPEAVLRAKSLLPTEASFVLIHPVSRWKFKCLSAPQMARLVEKLHLQGERIVLTASPDPVEVSMVQEILALIPHVPVCNLAGKTSLKELAALIQLCRGLISVDSVPLHMASALKTPVVAIFGPSSDINWGPWMHPQAKVVSQAFSCRPCYRDGCGGSQKSDCLLTLSEDRILEAFYSLKFSPKYEALASLFCKSSSTVPDSITFPSRTR
jgi:heptosyltransferase-3